MSLLDIDECSKGISGCSQLCTNTIGSYTCTCDNGYQLTNDNHTCTDIDECTLNNNGECEQTCHNTDGSYYCSCLNGFSLNDQNCTGIIVLHYFCYCALSSIDINECDTNNGGCEQDCINTIGSYQCQCSEGFQFTSNRRNCTGNLKTLHCLMYILIIDIDECADKNGGCEQICNNTVGSFQCSCLVGFTLTNDAFCSGKNIID